MTVQIRLFATLRQIAGGASVEVPRAEGDTVGTLLTRLVDIHPALDSELFASDGKLQGHIHVIVNGRDIRFLDGLDTQVTADAQILVFPPVGGGAPMSTQPEGEPAASSPAEPATAEDELTRVVLKFTGLVRGRMDCDRMEFAFAGSTLGALLNDLFDRYDLRDLILNEQGDVRPWARVAVNGRFSYLIGDMDAPIHDGDLVVLIYQYAVAF